MLSVHLSSRAAKELRRCEGDLRDRIPEAVEGLGVDPRPAGCAKLSGKLSGCLRLRVGTYRIIYEVMEEDRAVLVLKIGPRQSVYR